MLTSTADGFVAAGSAKAADGTTQAVLWTSRDGAGQSVLGIYYAAASGEDTVISGALGRGGSGTWLSTDGGSTWTQVTFPAGHGAENTISGLGSDGSGLSQAVPATASPIFLGTGSPGSTRPPSELRAASAPAWSRAAPTASS